MLPLAVEQKEGQYRWQINFSHFSLWTCRNSPLHFVQLALPNSDTITIITTSEIAKLIVFSPL